MYTLELCWSKIKEFLRSQATRTYSALDEALTAAINAIAPQDLLGWFRHFGYFVPIQLRTAIVSHLKPFESERPAPTK